MIMHGRTFTAKLQSQQQKETSRPLNRRLPIPYITFHIVK